MGYSNPTPFGTPGKHTEDELADRLAKLGGLSQVLLSHAPPPNTELDVAAPGVRCGSRKVLDYIDAHQSGCCFCGHIHEGAGRIVNGGAAVASNTGKPGYL